MFTPSPSHTQTLESLNSTFRFAAEGPTFKEVEGRDKPMPHKPGKFLCYLIDLQTGKEYHSAEGASEIAAFELAMKGAIEAPKPLTQAQAYSKQTIEMTTKLTDKDTEIVKLKAELEASKNKNSQLEAAAKQRGGKREEPLT